MEKLARDNMRRARRVRLGMGGQIATRPPRRSHRSTVLQLMFGPPITGPESRPGQLPVAPARLVGLLGQENETHVDLVAHAAAGEPVDRPYVSLATSTPWLARTPANVATSSRSSL